MVSLVVATGPRLLSTYITYRRVEHQNWNWLSRPILLIYGGGLKAATNSHASSQSLHCPLVDDFAASGRILVVRRQPYCRFTPQLLQTVFSCPFIVTIVDFDKNQCGSWYWCRGWWRNNSTCMSGSGFFPSSSSSNHGLPSPNRESLCTNQVSGTALDHPWRIERLWPNF